MFDPASPVDSPLEDDTRFSDARTWREVYLIVLGIFTFWVILLSILPLLFA